MAFEQAYDLRAENRPGVPMETEPRKDSGAHWDRPEQQKPVVPIQKHAGRQELPPVFGTCQPPSGLSGVARKFAYRIPEHKASHWMLLLYADRIDVLEHDVVDFTKRYPAVALGGGLLVFAGIAYFLIRRTKVYGIE